MNQPFLLFLIIVAWGCLPQEKKELPEEFQELKNLTVYSTDAKPGKTISFKKNVVYRDSKEVLIGRMGDMAVDDSGRVFIADVQDQSIHVFQPGGRFSANIGRKGKGPSEFGYIKSLQIRKDRLYVYDPQRQRVSVITLDSFAEDKSIPLARNRGKYQALHQSYPWIHKIFVRNNRNYLAEFVANSSTPTKEWQNVEIRGLLYPLDSTGKIASNKLIEFKEEIRANMGLIAPIKPVFGHALIVLSSDNLIYWAGPDHFLIKVYGPDGAQRGAFYYPHKKISLTRESAIKAEVPDLIIRNMKSMDLPRKWPVLTNMKIDDRDRLWIATTVEDMKVYEWWVLENSGELITRFTWPRSKPIQVIKDGYLYTRESEEETGLEEIVRYRIVMD